MLNKLNTADLNSVKKIWNEWYKIIWKVLKN
jgi:hypothetical protein